MSTTASKSTRKRAASQDAGGPGSSASQAPPKKARADRMSDKQHAEIIEAYCSKYMENLQYDVGRALKSELNRAETGRNPARQQYMQALTGAISESLQEMNAKLQERMLEMRVEAAWYDEMLKSDTSPVMHWTECAHQGECRLQKVVETEEEKEKREMDERDKRLGAIMYTLEQSVLVPEHEQNSILPLMIPPKDYKYSRYT